MVMEKKIIRTAVFLGMTAIILGAFGAHALKKILNLSELNTFETGVKYQMYHALFLLFIGANNAISNKNKTTIFYFIISGVLAFSGSLYLLATNKVLPVDFRAFGFVTPIGGLLLIMGWLWLFVSFFRKNS